MTERMDYHLGMVSERHEGSGPATISRGRGDNGGASYGTYQLSSKAGTLDKYLAQSTYGSQFAGLVPTTLAFDEKWRDLATGDPRFARDQQEFIRTSHYDVQLKRLKDAGIDLTDRGPAVQEALFSTSVQFGNVTRKIFREGLIEAYGKGYKLSELTDKEIVVAIQDFKLEHNNQLFRGSQTNWPGLLQRARAEKDELISLADGNPLPDLHPGASRVPAVLKQGSHGADVAALQRSLGELGYALDQDGKFGPDTRAAVKSFQQARGLESDGIVGTTTSAALAKASQELAGNAACGPMERPICLDNPSHPDHAFYRQTHSLVCELDRRYGRIPDQFSSNLASALVVSGRQAGLARIDRLALDQSGAVAWGVQKLPGSHLTERCCQVHVVQALNTPMEQSAVQWTGAMQDYTREQEAVIVRDHLSAPQASAQLAAQGH